MARKAITSNQFQTVKWVRIKPRTLDYDGRVPLPRHRSRFYACRAFDGDLDIYRRRAAAAAPKTKSRARGGGARGRARVVALPLSLRLDHPHRIPALLSIALLVSTSLKQGVAADFTPQKPASCKIFCDEIDIDANSIEVSNI